MFLILKDGMEKLPRLFYLRNTNNVPSRQRKKTS